MEDKTLSLEDFVQHLNKSVQICFNPAVTMDAKIIEIEELPKLTEFSNQPFSVIFRTEQFNEYYPQATYLLQHPIEGDVPIFLVPIGPDKEGMKYQAIFN
jgi:hypothetical protein